MMRGNEPAGDPDYLAGTPVFDAAGEKVGAVHGYDAAGGYLTVTKGWFFPKDTYVPLSVVGQSDAEGIYLTLAKEELERQSWETPPEGAEMATNAGAPVEVETVDGDLRMPVYAEELDIDTQVAEAGRLHIEKRVETERQTVTVPLRQERVTVAREALDEPDQQTLRDAFVERDYEVALRGEEAVVGKRIAGVEEVVITKDVVTVQQQVSDTVRKERVAIEEEGRIGVANTEGAPIPGASAHQGGKKRKRR